MQHVSGRRIQSLALTAAVLAGSGLLTISTWRSSPASAGQPQPQNPALTALFAATPEGSTVEPGIDAAKVKGADSCTKCHESEHAAWTKSVHFTNHERISSAAGSKYIADFGSKDACIQCHSTPHTGGGSVVGVSCESCHSPAGGATGWFDIHSDYGGDGVTREQETADHREMRLAATDAAGMIRSANVYELAKNCYTCHIVGNEKLLNAGHKPGQGGFDLIPWIQGEVRHNFQIDQKANAESPSLLQATKGITPEMRQRVMLVVGKMVELEVCLRNLGAISADSLKQGYAGSKGWAGRAEDAFDFLSEDILDAVKDEHIQAAVDAVDFRLGRRFDDQSAAAKAADKVAAAAKAFAAVHDGSKLKALDGLVGDLSKPKGDPHLAK